MPQAELMTNEILVLIGVPLGLLFSDLSSDGGVDVSEDDYIEVFIEFAYQTDKLCFLLDLALQRLFTVIVGHTFISSLSVQPGFSMLSPAAIKNEFIWLHCAFDPELSIFYNAFLEDFWDE